jgi:hypothetical protein
MNSNITSDHKYNGHHCQVTNINITSDPTTVKLRIAILPRIINTMGTTVKLRISILPRIKVTVINIVQTGIFSDNEIAHVTRHIKTHLILGSRLYP